MMWTTLWSYDSFNSSMKRVETLFMGISNHFSRSAFLRSDSDGGDDDLHAKGLLGCPGQSSSSILNLIIHVSMDVLCAVMLEKA